MIKIIGRSRQEISDAIAKALIKQKVRAMDKPRNQCVYLDHEGNKCAVGHCLPEDSKLVKIRGGVGKLLENIGCPDTTPEENEILRSLKNNADFFCRLQGIHDSEDSRERDRLLGILALKYPEVDTSAWKPWIRLGKNPPVS